MTLQLSTYKAYIMYVKQADGITNACGLASIFIITRNNVPRGSFTMAIESLIIDKTYNHYKL